MGDWDWARRLPPSVTGGTSGTRLPALLPLCPVDLPRLGHVDRERSDAGQRYQTDVGEEACLK
jgi:hypothetical protein